MIRCCVNRVFWVALLLIVTTTFSAEAQKRKKNKRSNSDRTAELPEELPFDLYEFKNINVITEYYNKRKLQKIQKLEEERNWPQLYKKLQDYVKNFAVQNFYRDTYLLWRLAKLTELFGDMNEAKSLYRLVLRHHHRGINLQEIELYYDSLSTQETEKYVPLDYYYELVEFRQAIDTLRPPRGVLLNMGPQVNSREADYGPSLNIDDSRLIFTSKRTETTKALEKVYNEDIYYSDFGSLTWERALPMDNINTIYNEGSATLSRDGNTIFFARCESPGGFGSCDIFTATKNENGNWTNAQNLGSNINSVGWDSHPALSQSEDTLFFASDRIGGFGLSDIYYSVKDKNGFWQPSKNMGPVINTRQNEVSPFMHPIENVLYFSSNGQLYNFGEFDIYKTYSKDGKWLEPLNIGPLVNGRGSEFYFTIDSKAEKLYYAKSANNDLDKLDLYSFPLPMGAQPSANTPISGTLTNKYTGNPFDDGIVSIIDLENGVEIAPKFLNDDGTFQFDLINSQNYLMVIQGDDFFRIEEVFSLDGPMNFQLEGEPIASRMQFESIEFENGEADLQTKMYGDLNKIVNFMYDNPDFKIKVLGHTDADGRPDFNLELSEKRAKNIRDYIVIFGGIQAERVSYEGYGSTKPLVQGNSEEAKALNRRVEFEIYRPGVQND